MTTPVRLITNDKSIIELMCTTLTMNVDRNVLPLPVPLGGGSRFGFDLNLPKSTITLEGVITDDDAYVSGTAIRASAVVDFSDIYGKVFSYLFAKLGNINKIIDGLTVDTVSTATHGMSVQSANSYGTIYFTSNSASFSLSCDTDTTAGGGTTFGTNPRIIRTASTSKLAKGQTVSGTGIPVGSKITSIDGPTLFRIDNDVTATNTGISLSFSGFYGLNNYLGKAWISVHNNTINDVRTPTELASSLANLINENSSDFGLTANIIDSPNTGETSTAVKLEQNTGGKLGNTSFPSFAAWPSNAQKPLTQQFKGGKNATYGSGYSAGDRVAELYGVLNNSNNGGLGVALGGIPAVVSELFDADGEDGFSPLDAKYGDYIIGLQIPFSSNVNNNTSLFYMPTGPFKSRDEKRADQAKPAGTEFESSGFGDSVYTGIKGAVANATFTQLGGEPIYTFVINFIPIDWIV